MRHRNRGPKNGWKFEMRRVPNTDRKRPAYVLYSDGRIIEQHWANMLSKLKQAVKPEVNNSVKVEPENREWLKQFGNQATPEDAAIAKTWANSGMPVDAKGRPTKTDDRFDDVDGVDGLGRPINYNDNRPQFDIKTGDPIYYD